LLIATDICSDNQEGVAGWQSRINLCVFSRKDVSECLWRHNFAHVSSWRFPLGRWLLYALHDATTLSAIILCFDALAKSCVAICEYYSFDFWLCNSVHWREIYQLFCTRS